MRAAGSGQGAPDGLAVYWDFENIHSSLAKRAKVKPTWTRQPELVDIDAVVSHLATFGPIAYQRAYGNWQWMRAYAPRLSAHNIDLVQMFPLGSGKNAADIRLALDAVVDVERNAPVGTVVVISGDGDFVPLAQRIRADGRTVIGIGMNGDTNRYWAQACDRFIYYCGLVDAIPTAANARPAGRDDKNGGGERRSRATGSPASTATTDGQRSNGPSATSRPARTATERAERPRTNGRHDHAESSGQGPSKRNGRTPSAVAPDSAENGRQVETTSGSRVSTGRATVQTASTDVPTGADPSEACRVSLRRHPRKLRLTGPAANSIGLEVAGALHETGASLDDMNRFVEPVAARLAAEGIAEGDDALAMARRVRDLLYAARVFWRTDDGVRRVVVAGDDIVTRVLETVASMLVGHHDDPLDPVVIAGLVVPDPQPCHTVVVADAIERGSAGDRRAPEPADVSDADQGGCPTAAAAATAVDGADAPAGGRDEARDPDDAVASMPEVPVAHTAGAGGDPGPATVEPDPAPASEVPNADIVLNDEFRSDADRGVPTAATSPIPDAGPAQVPGQPAEDLSTVDPGVEVSDGGHDRGPSGIVVPAIATFPPSEAMRAGLVPGRGRPGPADIRRLPVANGEAPSPAEAPWAPQPSEGGAPTDAAPGQGPSDTIGDGAMPSVGFPAAPVVAVWAEPNVDPGADGEPPSDAG